MMEKRNASTARKQNGDGLIEWGSAIVPLDEEAVSSGCKKILWDKKTTPDQNEVKQ